MRTPADRDDDLKIGRELEREITRAIDGERQRCLSIARFAEKFCVTDVGSGVARSIAEAIENDAIGPSR